MTRQQTFTLIYGSLAIASLGIFLLPPIPQDLQYHNFVDQRHFCGVDNFMDVVSNVGFLLVAIYGTYLLLIQRHCATVSESSLQERLPWLVFLCGVFLTGLGSAWYHLEPNNSTLVWDRLPMTIGFMGLFAAVIGELISRQWGLRLLPILLLVGFYSVYHWHITEQAGRGDLRPYALVQFLPMVLVPIMLLSHRSVWTRQNDLFIVLIWYLLAKVFEFYDARVFSLTGETISGHSIKHLCAAIATWQVFRMLARRQRITQPEQTPN